MVQEPHPGEGGACCAAGVGRRGWLGVRALTRASFAFQSTPPEADR